jgi:hypothetical protein
MSWRRRRSSKPPHKDHSWKDPLINTISDTFSKTAKNAITDKLLTPFMEIFNEMYGAEVEALNTLCPSIKEAHKMGKIANIGIKQEQAQFLGVTGNNRYVVTLPFDLPVIDNVIGDDDWDYRYEDYSKFPINMEMIQARMDHEVRQDVQDAMAYAEKSKTARDLLQAYLQGPNKFPTKWGEAEGSFDTFQQACYSFPLLKFFKPNDPVVNLRRPKIVYSPPKQLQDLVAEAIPLFKALKD